MNDVFDMAVKLREIHVTMRRFHGAEQFEAYVQDMEPWLRKVASHHDGSVTAAAVNSAKLCPNEMLSCLILAVAVELKLRANAKATEEARS